MNTDSFEWEGVAPEDLTATCKYCGEEPLWWSETPAGWRLIDRAGEIHTCFVKATPQEDFGIVEPEPTEDQWSEGEST